MKVICGIRRIPDSKIKDRGKKTFCHMSHVKPDNSSSLVNNLFLQMDSEKRISNTCEESIMDAFSVSQG